MLNSTMGTSEQSTAAANSGKSNLVFFLHLFSLCHFKSNTRNGYVEDDRMWL